MIVNTMRILLLSMLIFLLSPVAKAEGTADDNANSREVLQREFEAASLGMKQARQLGPLDIPLLTQAVCNRLAPPLTLDQFPVKRGRAWVGRDCPCGARRSL